ncbi:DUF7159 family protein [[Mycobacterium] fortunisiensis]|uniref:DUF7159 family protein n=1 Tax=[Mycobacterium] fortunisiensis TaxID=2600579 RepID=UPI001C256ECE|nr:hypothetical protein [[Mycobacterium] fortunisiensis]
MPPGNVTAKRSAAGRAGGGRSFEGVHVEAVLGVSMTPSTVGLVLVEGHDADGATVEHDAFDIRGHSSSGTDEICNQVVAAVQRTEKSAAEQGLQLSTIGVTWGSGVGAEAAVLLKKLTDAGFGDVVPVRLPQATDALARRVAGIVGFDTTGVCVLEPDVVQAMTVGAQDPIQTSVSRGIETVGGLTEWLSGIFDNAEPRPDALVVVGSAVDLDAVLPKLEQALSVPVFTPAEPGLPLARGAALASAQRGLRTFTDQGAASDGRRWPPAQLTPLAVLVGGVLAFAVSLCVAVGQQLLPGSEQTPHRPSRPEVSTWGDSASVHPAPAVVVPAPAPSTSQVPSALESVVQEESSAPVFDETVDEAPVVSDTGVDETVGAPTDATDAAGLPPDQMMPPEAFPAEPQPPSPDPALAESPPPDAPPGPEDPGLTPPPTEALPVQTQAAEVAPPPAEQVPPPPAEEVLPPPAEPSPPENPPPPEPADSAEPALPIPDPQAPPAATP